MLALWQFRRYCVTAMLTTFMYPIAASYPNIPILQIQSWGHMFYKGFYRET